MLTYVENMLTRLERAVDGHSVMGPYPVISGEIRAIILLVVQCDGQEQVIRADKFLPFLHTIAPEKRHTVHIGIGLSLIQITGVEEGYAVAEGVFDKALWEEDFGDKPLPPAPVFRMEKHVEVLNHDYRQPQNFIWHPTGEYATELHAVGNDDVAYLDLEYYLYVLLSDPQMFDHASQLIVNFLTHHNGKDEEWGKMLHARLVKMRYKTIFMNQAAPANIVH